MSALRFLVGLIVIALVAYIAYYKFGSLAPTDIKGSIDEGIAQAKKTNKLSAAEEEVLRVQLAITQYYAANHNPPESLESLVPKYFDEVPKDPQTGEKFAYVRNGESYLLGAQVAQMSSLQSGIANNQAPGAKEDAGKESGVDIENYVNPNTMKIEDFTYDPAGKRDPFLPFDFSYKPKIDESLPPLERYDIGQLKVTAILSLANGHWTAIIEDQAGKGYPVRVGTKVGTAQGSVASIEKDRVNVIELRRNVAGVDEQKVVVMKLQVADDKDKNKKSKAKK